MNPELEYIPTPEECDREQEMIRWEELDEVLSEMYSDEDEFDDIQPKGA